MTDVTRLLEAANRGDRKAAADLLPLVYGELRKLAASKLANEKPGQTLNATALVHEAYLRLVGDQQFDGRGHFFAAAVQTRVFPDFRSPLMTTSVSTSIRVNSSVFSLPSTSGFMHRTMRMSVDFATNVGVSIDGNTGTALAIVGARRMKRLMSNRDMDTSFGHRNVRCRTAAHSLGLYPRLSPLPGAGILNRKGRLTGDASEQLKVVLGELLGPFGVELDHA